MSILLKKYKKFNNKLFKNIKEAWTSFVYRYIEFYTWNNNK